MPGETRNYTFKLPDEVTNIEHFLVCFFQNGEKILEYDETMTEKIYGVEGQANLLVCFLPREDTLLFENKIKAELQMEWDVENRHPISKPIRISVGTYLNKEYLGV